MTTKTMLEGLQRDIELEKRHLFINLFFNTLFLIFLLFSYGFVNTLIGLLLVTALLMVGNKYSYTYQAYKKLNTLKLIKNYIHSELHTDDKVYNYSGKSFYLPDLKQGKEGQELLQIYVSKYLDAWLNTFSFASPHQVIEDEKGTKIIIQQF